MRTGVFQMVRSPKPLEKHNTPERECGRQGGWSMRSEQIMMTLCALGKMNGFITLGEKAFRGLQQGMITFVYADSGCLPKLPGGTVRETPAHGPSSGFTPNIHQMLAL